MSDDRPVLACNLDALSAEERVRRSALASRVFERVREVQETPDGYTVRLDGELETLRDALDWILLERHCCPFLRIELRVDPATGPVWLQLGGGDGVKEFLGASGLRAR
jgi:hypothetical protein